jgi:hypothetical protein
MIQEIAAQIAETGQSGGIYESSSANSKSVGDKESQKTGEAIDKIIEQVTKDLTKEGIKVIKVTLRVFVIWGLIGGKDKDKRTGQAEYHFKFKVEVLYSDTNGQLQRQLIPIPSKGTNSFKVYKEDWKDLTLKDPDWRPPPDYY